VPEDKMYRETTCCAPLCQSDSVKNPELSFYEFPVDSSLKGIWLNLLRIPSELLKSHKECSFTFPMESSEPAVVKISRRQTVTPIQGRKHIL
jgi:hypothetical protein